jgi:hypothetical protein
MQKNLLRLTLLLTHVLLSLSLSLSQPINFLQLLPAFTELHRSLVIFFSFPLPLSDSHVEVLSLSSGVGTSSQSGSAGSATTPTETHARSVIFPGMHVVCLENHSSGDPGSLHITQGDIIEGESKDLYMVHSSTA